MNKEILTRNFSRHARVYDRYAVVQRWAARELLGYLPKKRIRHILELGCGTGIYTSLLKKTFADARLEAIDISRDMIEVAKIKAIAGAVTFTVCDAEAAEAGGKFDLITSNAAFQWFKEPGRTVIRYRRALAKGGVMAFSTFGPGTFCELRRVLKAALGDNIEISSGSFLLKEKLENMLKNNFGSAAVKERIVKKRYASMAELLRTIKYTGARGEGLKNRFVWSEALLDDAGRLYKEKFGGITASYQVFFCKAAI